MSDITSVQIVGLDRLLKKLDYTSSQLRTAMRVPMGKAMRYIHSQVPGYPPPPSNSTYVRTGTLGRSITTKVETLGGDTVGKIGTNVIYAPYVISEKRQAWMHRGRWWTLQKVVRDEMGAVVNIFSQWVADLLARKA